MSRIAEKLAWNRRGPFTYEVRAIANPAVATDWSIVVPGSEVWGLVAIQATLTTDANVANRVPQLVIDDQTTTAVRYAATTAQAAGATANYSWIRGYPQITASAVAGLTIFPIADHVLQSGWRIRPITTLIQAGDQWSGITVTLERYSRPPQTMQQEYGVPIDDIIAAIAEKVQEAQ